MTPSSHRKVASLLTLSAVAAFGSSIASASPVEREVIPGPTGTTTSLRYGDHVNTDLPTTVDIDNYSFSARAGETVRVVVSGLTGSLGPQIVLRSPSGSILDSAACAPGLFTCSTNLEETVLTTGNYTLNISDAGSNNIGNYSLHIDGYPTPTNWLGIGYGITQSTDIGHHSDSDFYAFNGATGTRVLLTATSLTGSLGMRIEAWDPAGNLIHDDACSPGLFTCSVSGELNLDTAGLYRVSISDPAWNNTGSYQFSASCVSGNCPTTIPVIPEPEIYALMLAGLALVGIGSRRLRASRPPEGSKRNDAET